MNNQDKPVSTPDKPPSTSEEFTINPILGLGIGLATAYLLFYGQKHNTIKAAEILLAKAEAQEINPEVINPANEGKLVFLSGRLEAPMVEDPLFKISVRDALALSRRIDVLQWEDVTPPEPKPKPKKKKKKTTNKQNGITENNTQDGQIKAETNAKDESEEEEEEKEEKPKKRKRVYKKVWRDHLQASPTPRMENPTEVPVNNGKFTVPAEATRIGSFQLSEEQYNIVLNSWSYRSVNLEGYSNSFYHLQGVSWLSNYNYPEVVGNYIYLTPRWKLRKYLEENETVEKNERRPVGTIRIRFSALYTEDISIAAMQRGNSFAPYNFFASNSMRPNILAQAIQYRRKLFGPLKFLLLSSKDLVGLHHSSIQLGKRTLEQFFGNQEESNSENSWLMNILGLVGFLPLVFVDPKRIPFKANGTSLLGLLGLYIALVSSSKGINVYVIDPVRAKKYLWTAGISLISGVITLLLNLKKRK